MTARRPGKMMPKLGSPTESQTVISICSRGAKKPPVVGYPPRSDSSFRIYRGTERRCHDLRSCSTARTTPCGAKAVPQARTPSRRVKRRPRTVHDPADCSSAQIRCLKRKPGNIPGGDDLLLYCYAQTPFWGKKRARNAHALGGPLLPVTIHHDSKRKNQLIDWTNLGDGPAGLIADHLLANDVADYIRFRAVCRPWRLCSRDPREQCVLDRRFHPRQWIMLRETVATPHRRRLLNVSSGHCICIDLPELHGHDVFGPTAEGLLVLLDRRTFVIRLLNPVTRQVVDLPPANMLLSQSDHEETCDVREDLEVSSAGLADNTTVAVNFSRIRTVAVVKPGDSNWIVVDHDSLLFPALSFAGCFYCATTRAIMVVETSIDQPPRLVMAAKLTRKFSRLTMDTVHLVDNDGVLMLVHRQLSGSDSRKYEVYKVDLVARRTMPVCGLDGRAMFIGIERGLSVSPSVFPTISPDAIYLGFDDQLTGRMDESPCYLMDGNAEHRDMHDSIDGMPCYGPRGVDHYLSWCVTGYRDDSEDT